MRQETLRHSLPRQITTVFSLPGDIQLGRVKWRRNREYRISSGLGYTDPEYIQEGWEMGDLRWADAVAAVRGLTKLSCGFWIPGASVAPALDLAANLKAVAKQGMSDRTRSKGTCFVLVEVLDTATGESMGKYKVTYVPETVQAETYAEPAVQQTA